MSHTGSLSALSARRRTNLINRGFVLGGNRTNFAGEVGTLTAEMLLIKIVLNSVVSTNGAKFMTINISDFYLNTPLTRFEYVKLKMNDIPDEIKAKYKLHNKAIDGHVYVEVRKTIYGLP